MGQLRGDHAGSLCPPTAFPPPPFCQTLGLAPERGSGGHVQEGDLKEMPAAPPSPGSEPPRPGGMRYL